MHLQGATWTGQRTGEDRGAMAGGASRSSGLGRMVAVLTQGCPGPGGSIQSGQ